MSAKTTFWKKEKREVLPKGKSDQETCQDLQLLSTSQVKEKKKNTICILRTFYNRRVSLTNLLQHRDVRSEKTEDSQEVQSVGPAESHHCCKNDVFVAIVCQAGYHRHKHHQSINPPAGMGER